MTEIFNKEDSLIEFPCDFMLKVMGHNNEEFEDIVLTIVHKHFPNFGNSHLKKRTSRNHHYLSLTITVHAENKNQLDELYRELSKNKAVLMAL